MSPAPLRRNSRVPSGPSVLAIGGGPSSRPEVGVKHVERDDARFAALRRDGNRQAGERAVVLRLRHDGIHLGPDEAHVVLSAARQRAIAAAKKRLRRAGIEQELVPLIQHAPVDGSFAFAQLRSQRRGPVLAERPLERIGSVELRKARKRPVDDEVGRFAHERLVDRVVLDAGLLHGRHDLGLFEGEPRGDLFRAHAHRGLEHSGCRRALRLSGRGRATEQQHGHRKRTRAG